MKQTIPSTEIVIVLAQHPVLGHLLVPYTVARRDNEMGDVSTPIEFALIGCSAPGPCNVAGSWA